MRASQPRVSGVSTDSTPPGRSRRAMRRPAVPAHLAAFDSIAEELQQRALDLLLAIRVVVARVDDTHRRGAGARRDEHEPATRAPTQGEQIGDGVVLVVAAAADLRPGGGR